MTRKHLGICLLAGLASLAATGRSLAQEPLKSAHCVVRLVASPNYLPVTSESVEALLRSNGVSGAARRAVFGEKAVEVGVRFEAFKSQADSHWREGSSDGLAGSASAPAIEPGVLLGIITVESESKATELLMAICENLRHAFAAAQEAERVALEKEVEELRHQHVVIRQLLAGKSAIQSSLQKGAKRSDLSRQRILNELSELESEFEHLRRDLIAGKAREEAVAAQIARLGAAQPENGEMKEVIEQLARVVEMRKRDVELVRVLHTEGQASAIQLNESLEREARARVELAERRAALRHESNGDQLALLNKELLSLTIDLAEKQARLEYTQERLSQFAEDKLVELADRFEQEVMFEMSVLRESLRNTTHAIAVAEQKLRKCRDAEVTIIGAAPAP